MRKESILEMLEEAYQTINVIRNYHSIPKVKVKDILGNLRSPLDYLANDINENLSVPNKKKFYFPFGPTQLDFDNSVKRYFPLLKNEMPKIYDEITNIQPFVSGDDWLIKLWELTNDTKHNNPIDIKHTSEVIKSVTANAGNTSVARFGGNASNIRVQNIQVNGQLMDDFIYDKGNIIVTKKREIEVNFKITKDKKILVGDELFDLLPFLEKCHDNLKVFIEKMYILLNEK
ncbi:hypothetical protein [Acinetobacter baumannii]|uniref:hypothetical protein n=1 Tax=Acinetobacter baumannii TaxID=470 RepID=UPI0022EAA3AC|nr:hypothetical protein [Acinetobacter baumannii]MDA3519553.1 hypothetical protein [Acinetobacter baumannii]MDC5251249.1 hypothetical protein [Acinetobacter baumannii]HCA4900517.1 hypothetical protein [Acinetobacter baumannii]